MKKRFTIVMALALVATVAFGCGLPGASVPASQSVVSGQVEFWVTDAPRADNVSEIWVHVTDVEVHKAAPDEDGDQEGDNDGEWISANITGPNPFELLALRGTAGSGIQQVLATANITPGKYTQIRMTIDEVKVRLGDGDNITAKLPSGALKFVQPFEVAEWSTTKLLFDFDADKSVKVNYTGADKEPKIIMTPVIKLTVEKPRPNAAAVTITTDRNLPKGTDNVWYTTNLTATGGTPPYTWVKLSGDLPAGLELHSNGVIDGTPTATGTYGFTIQVSDNSTPQEYNAKHFFITIED